MIAFYIANDAQYREAFKGSDAAAQININFLTYITMWIFVIRY